VGGMMRETADRQAQAKGMNDHEKTALCSDFLEK